MQMLFVAITLADMKRRKDVIKFAKRQFEREPTKGAKIIDVFVMPKCRAIWVFEADTVEDIFKWFSPLQPVYEIVDLSPVIPIQKLWALYDRELGETVTEVQTEKRKT